MSIRETILERHRRGGGGDDRTYAGLKAPVGDSLFAAYDPLDIKAAKYLIVASSYDLYTPRSLFWPDAIFLTAPKLDWGQTVGMTIIVRRTISMDPQVIVIAGSIDHLQSRWLVSRLTDGSIPSNEVIGEMVKIIFVLSPGYVTLPEPLQFVYTMVTTLAEGRFSVIIPAPNRIVDPDNFYPARSELPDIWADISYAIQGFKDCSTTPLVLDEVLGLELSNFANFARNDLWFRQLDYATTEQGRMVRRNVSSAEEDLMALALRTKPHTNSWLCLSRRLCTLGEDAFDHAPAAIKEIHTYLKNLLNERELAQREA